MTRTATLLFALPLAALVGCTKPDLEVGKLRLGMSKKEVVDRVGQPTRTTVVDGNDIFEYVAYDRYGAIKVNERSQFVRFVNGRVDLVGSQEDLATVKPGTAQPAAPVAPPAAATPQPAPSFDLRGELEKLEKLKKDGLISEAEYAALRQRVIEKAKTL